jgi:hypothetical protein
MRFLTFTAVELGFQILDCGRAGIHGCGKVRRIGPSDAIDITIASATNIKGIEEKA